MFVRITCKRCKSDLTNSITLLNKFYACDICDSWTANIEHKAVPFISLKGV